MTTTEILETIKSGMWIRAGASDLPEISALLTACADKCHELNLLRPSMRKEREQILRELLGSVGQRFVVNSPFRCDFGFNIHIGENFIANFNLTILDEADVNIGDNVQIGPNCSLITITHSLDSNQRNEGMMQAKPITISNNVWLASNVVVLPGVTIGENSVVGAGSVVTRDIPQNEVWAGNPARFIKQIPATVH